MRKFDSTLHKLFLMVLVLSTIIPEAFSQNFANATARNSPVRDFQKITTPRAGKDQVVSLKDALQNLKKRFHLKFAYREGLLDGKVILASSLDQQLEPEIILSNILSQC